MKQVLLAAALAGLLCCGKSEAPAPDGAACASAAAKAVSAFPSTGTGAVADVPAKLKAILTTRCTEDSWSAATIECYQTKVTDMRSMKICRETLPQDQQQKLMGDIRTVMMSAAGGGGGGPMHGGPGGPPPASPAPHAPTAPVTP